jgi:hypothetical protein
VAKKKKKPAAKKPAPKKPAAKKKPVVKKAAKKKPAKKPAPKKPAPKAKPAAAKKTKKPVVKKAAKKPKKEMTTMIGLLGGPVLLDGGVPGGADAVITITAPVAGPVPPSMPLVVSVTTNRQDLPHQVILKDITGAPVVIQTIPVPPVTGSPFVVTIPAANLPPGRTFEIRAKIDPGAGATPPHGQDAIVITT